MKGSKPKSGRAGEGRQSASHSIARAMRIIRMIGQSNGLTASEIVARLKDDGIATTNKRVRELLGHIQGAGIGVWEDQSDKSETGASRWKQHIGIRIGEVLQLNRQELMALYLSRQSLLPLKKTKIFQDFETAFAKIDKVLGRPQIAELKNLESEIHFSQFQGFLIHTDTEIVNAVHAACAEGHVLECSYHSPSRGKVETRKLGPHFLTYTGGALYLFAEDLEAKIPKTFAITRMKSAKMLSDEYYDSSKLSYQEAFGDNLSIVRGTGQPEKIVLRFKPGGATTYVRERLWHPSQAIENLDDGSIRLMLKVAQSSHLVKWILGFEDAVEIIEPHSLREKVITAAESILKVYRKPKAA